MKELLDNIKKIFSKKLTLAVVLVIVAALAIVGLCTWYHFSIEPLGNGYAPMRSGVEKIVKIQNK